jgi:hypothetical protein
MAGGRQWRRLPAGVRTATGALHPDTSFDHHGGPLGHIIRAGDGDPGYLVDANC